MGILSTSKLESIFKVHNRWVCIVIYMLAIFLTSCVYYGFQHMQFVLILSGKFEDVCPEGSVRPPDADRDSYLCDEQANAIDAAYTTASSFEFSGGLLAGLLYDYSGPVVSASIGELLHFCSWFLILLTNSSWSLYIGFAMLGLAVNLVAIPAMILMLRFPRYPMLIESINLSSQTLTAFTMPTIYSLLMANPTWTWNNIMSVYLPISLCVAIFYIYLLPYKQSQIPQMQAIVKRKPHFHPLKYYFLRPQYIAFIIWYTLMVMQMSMFNVKLDTVATKEVSEYVGWIFWLQAPLGVAFGFLNEKLRSIYMCMIINAMMLIAFVLTIINTAVRNNYDGDDWTHKDEIMYYIGATLYVVGNSYIYTVKYTWITETFPTCHFGTLVGVIGLSAGVLQTINSAFGNVDAMTMLSVYCAISVICVGLLVYLWKTTIHSHLTFQEPIRWSISESIESGTSGKENKSEKPIMSISSSESLEA